MKIVPNNRSFYSQTTPIKWLAVALVKQFTKCNNHETLWSINADSVYKTKDGKIRTVKYLYYNTQYYVFDKKNIIGLNMLFEENFKDTRWKVEILIGDHQRSTYTNKKSNYNTIRITRRIL